MVRISYKMEGILLEEIINPHTTPITDEILSNLDKIYIFKNGKTMNGRHARTLARKLMKESFYYKEQ